jgi:HK97 gp10 family phage protein
MPRQYNHLPQAAVMLHQQASKAVKKIAFDLEALAKSKCKRVTGYCADSIYVHTWDTSNYGQGVSGGKEGAYLLSDVGRPEHDQAAFVGVGANYGVYLEYGTSRMPAQPYMTPAAEELSPVFVEVMSRIEEKMREQGLGVL